MDEDAFDENGSLLKSVKSLATKIAGLLVVKAAISGVVDNVSEMIQMRSVYQDALGASAIAKSGLTDQVRANSLSASVMYGLDATTYVERVNEAANSYLSNGYSNAGAVE